MQFSCTFSKEEVALLITGLEAQVDMITDLVNNATDALEEKAARKELEIVSLMLHQFQQAFKTPNF